MKPGTALANGGLAAAACVACCAPPIIGALGVTAGLAVTAGLFLGLVAAIAVVLVSIAWIAARSRRTPTHGAPTRVPVATPTRRPAP